MPPCQISYAELITPALGFRDKWETLRMKGKLLQKWEAEALRIGPIWCAASLETVGETERAEPIRFWIWEIEPIELSRRSQTMPDCTYVGLFREFVAFEPTHVPAEETQSKFIGEVEALERARIPNESIVRELVRPLTVFFGFTQTITPDVISVLWMSGVNR